MERFRYRDRYEAGSKLARDLAEFADDPGAIVLALPRGGVPVGYEVAVTLHVPLDVYVVRKLGVPGHEELAMGAIAGDGSCVLDHRLVAELHIPPKLIEDVVDRELAELRRRQAAYRDDRPERHLAGKDVILIDDGLATGSSMYAAASAVREQRPARVVAAVPVGAPDTCEALRRTGDRVVCAYAPPHFGAVGLYYEDFTQVGDDEVRRLLAHAAALETARNFPTGQ